MKITLLTWTDESWEDYLYWQNDKAKLARINNLLKDIRRLPFKGIGKPEKLKFKRNIWSRRITREHRIVYEINQADESVIIHSCRYHYD